MPCFIRSLLQYEYQYFSSVITKYSRNRIELNENCNIYIKVHRTNKQRLGIVFAKCKALA